MVIAGGFATARTAMNPSSWLDSDNNAVAGELDRPNGRSDKAKNAIECSADAHGV